MNLPDPRIDKLKNEYLREKYSGDLARETLGDNPGDTSIKANANRNSDQAGRYVLVAALIAVSLFGIAATAWVYFVAKPANQSLSRSDAIDSSRRHTLLPKHPTSLAYLSTGDPGTPRLTGFVQSPQRSSNLSPSFAGLSSPSRSTVLKQAKLAGPNGLPTTSKTRRSSYWPTYAASNKSKHKSFASQRILSKLSRKHRPILPRSQNRRRSTLQI